MNVPSQYLHALLHLKAMIDQLRQMQQISRSDREHWGVEETLTQVYARASHLLQNRQGCDSTKARRNPLMSEHTSIEWTNATWNPLTGCTRVTAGCTHCYAFALHDMRHTAYLHGKSMPEQYHQPFSVIQLLPDRLQQPLHVKQPKRYFVNSMSDLFHSEVPDDYIHQVFEVMSRAHWHTFQVLTKRVGRLRRLGSALPWPANVWMGVSIEEDRLTPRADALRAVPASVRFLSCEPLLGPLPSLNLDGIEWVITGGESGPNARPCDPDWVRDLRDRCVAENVAFFHKQWGGRTPKAGGRVLDGRTWDEFPVARVRERQQGSSKPDTEGRHRKGTRA